jgi:hypothetical protein
MIALSSTPPSLESQILLYKLPSHDTRQLDRPLLPLDEPPWHHVVG